MRIRSLRASTRFKRSVFRGRCRRNLLAGLTLFILAVGYGTWAAHRVAMFAGEGHAFDQRLVDLAQSIAREPAGLRAIRPRNARELYLLGVIAGQRDVLAGFTAFLLRLIVALTTAGLGLVLLTAGATEWEIRSEDNGRQPVPAVVRVQPMGERSHT